MGDELLNPRSLRASMARRGISPNQLRVWWSPDTDRDVHPLDDRDTQTEVRAFLAFLWEACLKAERAPSVAAECDRLRGALRAVRRGGV